MKPITFLLALSFALAGCSGRDARSVYDEARAAEDSAKLDLALGKYEELVRDFPTEALAETSLYRLVTLRSNIPGAKAEAVAAQRRFLALYPRSGWAPNVTFMLAFNYNNELAQFDSARKYYELFLAGWPDHELAASARFELENIGKGPEELLLGGAGGVTGNGNTASGTRPK